MTKKPANTAKIAATTFESKEVAALEVVVVAAEEVDVGEVAVPGAVVPPFEALGVEALGVEAAEAEALGVDAEALVLTEPDDVVVAAPVPEPEELKVIVTESVVVGFGPVGVRVVPPIEEERIRI